MKRIFAAFFVFWFAFSGLPAVAAGVQIDFLLAGLRNPLTDAFLANGLVYTYAAGTTASKSLYMDAALVSASTNPVVLDAYGRAVRYGSGKYKFVIKTSAGSLLWTLDNLEYSSCSTLASQTTNPFGATLKVTNFTTSNLTATLAADLNANGYQIHNVATATLPYDLVTLGYVDQRDFSITAATTASFSTLEASIASTTASNTAAFASLSSVIGYAFDCSLMVSSPSYAINIYVLASGGPQILDDFVVTNADSVSTATFHITIQGYAQVGRTPPFPGGLTIVQTDVILSMSDTDGNLYTSTRVFTAELASTVQHINASPFSLSANVDVGPGVSKTIRLVNSHFYGTGSDVVGAVGLSTDDRWYNWFRVK